ncbi:MAG: VanW family protein [Christensenellaceae bacterium]|jgi:vancomycin resistance protein YoaR|nr:VanW family protein [Christensenellaceae bacterium]
MADKKPTELNLPSYMKVKGGQKPPVASSAPKQASGAAVNERTAQAKGRKSASSARAAQPSGGRTARTAKQPAKPAAPAALDLSSSQIANRARGAEQQTQKNQRKFTLHPGRLLAILAVIAVVWGAIYMLQRASAAPAYTGPLTANSAQKLPDGVRVLGLDVGGKTKASARSSIAAAADALLGKAGVTLQLGDTRYTITGAEAGLTYDVEAILNRAMAYDPQAENTDAIDITSGGNAGEINDVFTWDSEALRRAVQEIAIAFDIAPIDAIGAPTLHEDHSVTFTYQEGREGRALDTNATADKIEAMFRLGIYAAEIEGIYNAVPPSVTAGMISQHLQLRASFTTKYAITEDTITQNRVFNIHKAADIINNCVVLPGEEWGFNQYVGLRTAQDGWKEANGIAYGKDYTLQVGGGICQVSTTLYNALLCGNITITDRLAHSIPSSYVPKGLDATVDSRGIDLKFRNDTSAPLYLFTYYEQVEGRHQETVTFLIYGQPLENNISYQGRSEVKETPRKDIIYTDDATIPRGYKVITTESRPAYVAEVYLDKYVGNGKVSSEYLYTDTYAGNAEYARRGTASPKYYTPPANAVPMN